MIRLRSVSVLTAGLAVAAYAFSASPAAAADQVAACDPALAAGLKWSAPSSLAWGRGARIGANVLDSIQGPAYQEDSVALAIDTGTAQAASDPIDHDLEFIVKAPANGTAVTANATWLLSDDAAGTRCAQTAAMSIPTGFGKIVRYSASSGASGITWRPMGAGDCEDAAVEPITLTLRQGGVTRQLRAPDQCAPSGNRHVSTRDWELSMADGAFHLAPLKTHSSLHARLRYVLRVGSRRVASGSLALAREYVAVRTIKFHDSGFWPICVHGMGPKVLKAITTPTGAACVVEGSFKVRLTLA